MSILDAALARRIVPVVEIDDARHAVPLADALIAGGLPVVEITFRTAAAAEAIAAIARARPDMNASGNLWPWGLQRDSIVLRC